MSTNEAKAIKLTNHLDIDLSSYLDGIECRASLTTLFEEFECYRNFSEILFEGDYAVLLSLSDIQTVSYHLINEHNNKRCTLMYSLGSFEELLIQMFDNDEYNDEYNDDNIIELDEIIENFENYGFKAFESTFEKYKENERDGDWIDSLDAMNVFPICVFWDDSLTDDFIQDILHKTTIHYLYSEDVIAHDFNNNLLEDSYIVNTSPLDEDIYSNEYCLPYQLRPDTLYDTKVCYRGVLLSDVKLKIPKIARVFTEINVTANIIRGDFIPSVNRRGLTYEQKQMLSYAVGKAIHMYLLDKYSYDKDFALALKGLLIKDYSVNNLLVK